MSQVKVLIVDDSNLMRKLLSSIVAKDPRLQVVGTAENGNDALTKIEQLQPDVVTLDLNMPVMDGITTLREANQRKLAPAFLVVSSLAQKDAQITIDAINEGAVDYIPKPSQMMGMAALEGEIISKIVMCYESRRRNAPEPPPAPPPRMASNPGAVRPSGPPGASPGTPMQPATGSNPGQVRPPGAAPGTPLRPAGAPAGASNPGQVRPPGAPPGSPPGGGPQLARAGGSNPGQVRSPGDGAAPAGGSPRPAATPTPGMPPAASGASVRPRLTIFGGSAGSMQLLQKIIPFVPQAYAGVTIFVLHLPAFFTTQLAAKLKEICPIPVEEAKDGLPLSLRKIYLAPGGAQNLVLARNPAGKGVVFKLIENDGTSTVTPSIDVFMKSASEIFRDACRGVLISGTGTDGIEGLRRIKEKLGEAYVQDRTSAVANQLVNAALQSGVPQKSLQIPEIIELFL